MNRRGFLGKLVKATTIAVVAPTILASAISTPNVSMVSSGAKCAPGEFMSFHYGGRTFHMKKWTHDAMIRHKANRELEFLGWAVPKPDGTLEYLKFKKND